MSEIDLEQPNTDASSEVSSEPQPAVQETSNAEAPQAEAQPNEGPNTPFHEHPRFKELVEQKNQYATQAKQLEQAYRQMQAKLDALEKRGPGSQSEKDALVERLKQIDPEFGDRFAKLNSSLSELEGLKQWKAQMEAQTIRTQATSKLEQLYSENKVPQELRGMYQAAIKDMASADPNIGINDLPQLFQQVHSNMSKYLDSLKRTEREGYVVDKKKDASAPTSPKGKPVPAAKEEIPTDPAELRQWMVKRTLKYAREGSNT